MTISCAPPGCSTYPGQLIPVQYQGWVLLIFFVAGTIAVAYGIYRLDLEQEKRIANQSQNGGSTHDSKVRTKSQHRK